MLQQFAVTAGGRLVNTRAQWLRIESVSAGGLDESVRVRADGQDLGTYLPGDALTLPIPASSWEITPVTATASAVVRLGMGTVQSARLSGVVQVVDTSKQTTLAGLTFQANGSNTATAALWGAVQLWNPAGSGKRFVIEQIQINNGSAAANTAAIGFSASQFNGGGSGTIANKLSGGGVGSAVINQRSDSGADLVGFLNGVLYGVNLAASASVVYTPRRPLVLNAGLGLAVIDRVANSQLSANFEYYEELAT